MNSTEIQAWKDRQLEREKEQYVMGWEEAAEIDRINREDMAREWCRKHGIKWEERNK